MVECVVGNRTSYMIVEAAPSSSSSSSNVNNNVNVNVNVDNNRTANPKLEHEGCY